MCATEPSRENKLHLGKSTQSHESRPPAHRPRRGRTIDSEPRRLTLPSTHTGLLFLGPAASVYFHRQPPFVSGEQSYAQTKALVTFDSAAGTLREFVNGAWRNERIAGRGFSHLPAGVPHEVRWESEADVIEIYYEPAFLRELPPENVTSVLARDALPAAADDPVIWDLALAICLWCADGMPASTIITDLGLLIGKRLFLRHGEPRATKTGPRFTTEQRRRLDDHIRTNIAKPIRVPQLAKAVSVSVSHFNVLCRNTTGKSAMDYLREWRLWKAHAMARTGNYRHREIAHACGFYDGGHLNREFRRFFRKSPGVPALVGLWLACSTASRIRTEFERAVLDIKRPGLSPNEKGEFDEDCL